ncbi:hypothetical protein CBA19CS22_39690 [Caballeronia novacaledonica]|uniref:Uncharacterized protein n=1 Tax=Caballeronia novacaledonica TaxID=1544861 RepID=A0ACB5R6U9_9BURK|nr:hypothetical protein CBA19CS22_39690 [Caballeronia novacaledonica]
MAPVWKVDTAAAWLPPAHAAAVLALPRLDPYLVWAVATHFDELGGMPAGFVPIAIEAKRNVARAWDLANIASGKDWFWMSELYRYPPAGLEATRFCTAFVTLAFLDHLDVELNGMIERFTLATPVLAGEPLRGDAVNTSDQRQRAPASQNTAFGKAVVGVCDDGIAFAHQHFYADAGGAASRVRCFWNQDDPDNSAAGLGYGREMLETEMRKLMTNAGLGGAIDEDAVYLAAGNTSVARRWAHGTATLDLAAGAHPLRPPPPLPDGIAVPEPIAALVAVQFRQPGRTVRDTSGLWLDAQALDAFRYIITRAQDIAGADCRAFINMSYGYFAGPHDGSSILEEAMDELADTNTCSIVLPAGNSNLDRCHGTLTMDAGKTKTLRWRVMPECLTPSFVEIWLPGDADPATISVNVVPPGAANVDPEAVSTGGAASGVIAFRHVGTWTQQGRCLCTVVHRGVGARGAAPMILIALAPTMTRDPKRQPAPHGDWMIQLTNTGANQVTVQAWVQRNETPDGFPPRGRQSRFDDDDYVRFDPYTAQQDYDGASPASWIRREGTLSSIATGAKPCVVGGYQRDGEATAPYSSTGFDQHRDPSFQAAPSVAAVSDRSIVRKGVMAAGTRSSSSIPFEGTSAAAPQILRMSAVPGGPFAPNMAPTNIRDGSRDRAKRQTFVNGTATADNRLLDADEQRRRNAEENVGAGNVASDKSGIEDD